MNTISEICKTCTYGVMEIYSCTLGRSGTCLNFSGWRHALTGEKRSCLNCKRTCTPGAKTNCVESDLSHWELGDRKNLAQGIDKKDIDLDNMTVLEIVRKFCD